MLKGFRERRVGVSKESIYDPVKVRNAMRVIKELLAARGHPNATVRRTTEEVSATSLAITFVIDEGDAFASSRSSLKATRFSATASFAAR